MCFAFDALPPDLPADLALAPIAGGANAERLELTSADGTHFMAAFAQAPEPRGLEAAGFPHEVVVYPGAPHSFFDRAYEQHAEACADAWRRTLGFLGGLAA